MMPSGRAVTALTNKLTRYSFGGNILIMIEMLDKAILHGWDSVYQLKEDELAEIVELSCPTYDAEVHERWV